MSHIVCVCVSHYVRVTFCACARARARVCTCVCVHARMCVHTYICSHCESYNINSIIFYIMKYKTYFEVILFSFDEVKFNNDSEQFEFGTHAARCMGCEIAQ